MTEAILPVEDVTDGKALVVWEYEGEPSALKHGGPARLLVPHLYFWKSAIQTLLEGLGGGEVDCFVCGSAGFVEVASTLLIEAGQPARTIRTERFGPTGG